MGLQHFASSLDVLNEGLDAAAGQPRLEGFPNSQAYHPQKLMNDVASRFLDVADKLISSSAKGKTEAAPPITGYAKTFSLLTATTATRIRYIRPTKTGIGYEPTPFKSILHTFWWMLSGYSMAYASWNSLEITQWRNSSTMLPDP